jgi:hypothetical protein
MTDVLYAYGSWVPNMDWRTMERETSRSYLSSSKRIMSILEQAAADNHRPLETPGGHTLDISNEGTCVAGFDISCHQQPSKAVTAAQQEANQIISPIITNISWFSYQLTIFENLIAG